MNPLLKLLTGGNNPKDLPGAEQSLSRLNQQVAADERALAEAKARQGNRVLEAKTQDDLDRIASELEMLRRNADRSTAARDAVEARVAALQADAHTQQEEARWHACRTQQLAFVAKAKEVDKQLSKAAGLVGELKRLGDDLYDMLPSKVVAGSPISPISSFDQQVQLALSVHSGGLLGPLGTGSDLWTHRQRVQFVAVMDQLTAHWLSGRPYSFDSEPKDAA